MPGHFCHSTTVSNRIVAKMRVPFYALITLLSATYHAHSMKLFSVNIGEYRLRDVDDIRILKVASDALDVAPPWNAPIWVWTLSRKMQTAALPILHMFDRCKSTDTFVNLSVLWWKAISGNRVFSNTFDRHFAHDMLPSLSRLVVSFPWCYLYPNLLHQNVAMRTRFLNQALQDELAKVSGKGHTNVVILGGGFDTRALRLSQSPALANVSFFEFDLPQVITQKISMVQRLVRRRHIDEALLPKYVAADLNNVDDFRIKLQRVLENASTQTSNTLFVSEAVLMYLAPGNADRVLSTCAEVAGPRSSYCSLCFADRLIERQGGEAGSEKEAVASALMKQRFRLDSYLPKPGRARHMGVAHYVK